MFCKKCGNQLNEGAAFCPCCGEKVVLTQQAQTSVASPTQSAVQSDAGSKNMGFWKFIWCDGLFLLVYIPFLTFIVSPNNPLAGAYVIGVAYSIITAILRRSEKYKVALVFLVITLVLDILMGLFMGLMMLFRR